MLILVYGADSYSSTKKVEAMREQFKNKFDQSGLNLAEFPSTGTDKIELGAVSQAVTSPPFLGAKRMVIVKNLISAIKKSDSEPWLNILTHIPESTIVILWDKEGEKTIEKHELFKKLAKGQDVFTYAHQELSGPELSRWAQSFSKSINLQITPGLLEKVVAMVGGDLWQLSGELKKLSARSGLSSVSEEMIKDLVRTNMDDQIFAFIDAVAARDQARAIRLLADERLSGAEDMYLFSMMARQIRLLLGARDVLDRLPGASKQELAEALDVHPFVAQKTLSQAKSFSSEYLKKLHNLCFEFDAKIKLGLDQGLAVDRLVAEFVTRTS